MTVCKPCPHFPGYYGGFQYSDVTCPICRYEARIRKLEEALRTVGSLIDVPMFGTSEQYSVMQHINAALNPRGEL